MIDSLDRNWDLDWTCSRNAMNGNRVKGGGVHRASFRHVWVRGCAATPSRRALPGLSGARHQALAEYGVSIQHQDNWASECSVLKLSMLLCESPNLNMTNVSLFF